MTITEPTITPKYVYDLGAPLYLSRWTYERPMAQNYTLLYSPDSTGMPILVSLSKHELYRSFVNGAVVGEVIQRQQGRTGASFTEIMRSINELVDRGFVRDTKDPPFFKPEPYRPNRKRMNIWLHINNNCNLACSYCFVEHTNTRMEEKTLSRAVVNISETVRKYEVKDLLIKFAGGEPTLSLRQMEWFHEKLTSELIDTGCFLHWTVLTNGTNMSSRFIEFVHTANASVSISIDGYGEYHNIYRVFRRNRSKGSWDIINKNIKLLQEEGVRPYINLHT
jgi:sulfatase maturation enzyme AslB (radical SAM superfamily)